MKPPAEWIHRILDLSLLRCASLVVPGKQRSEWWREWHAELWHVRQACAPEGSASWMGEREITAFCLGAFRDALCLRGDFGKRTRPAAVFQGSAAQCVLALAAALVASYAVALLLPGVRAERSLSPRQVSPGLVLIQNAGYSDDDLPTISPAQYRVWKGRKQQYFDGFAFYRVAQESVEREFASSGSREQESWEIARASSNLFVLLGLPVKFRSPEAKADSSLPELILSEKTWKREFGADPNVSGMEMNVGQRRARIVGIVPDDSRGLPGNVDAWLLQPDSAIVSSGVGYAVAHLTALGESEMWRPRVPITVYNSDEPEDDLLGISLGEGTPEPWPVFLFTVLLAFLALPAVTSVSLGEYSVCSQRPSWSKKLCSWGFLIAKIALLLAIVNFVSLDLAYARTTLASTQAVYIQLVSSFSLCLFGLRWVFKDQRQRCPVCLRRVEHPAQVGLASRTFLAWNGTELVCMGGHTLLHVPGLPTSWFSTQRWLYLDTSWEFLFAPSVAGPRNELLSGWSAH